MINNEHWQEHQRPRDHFVARADVERPQRQRDRVRSRAYAHGMRRAGSGSELRLERLDLRSEHEPAARQNTCKRRVDIGAIVTRHERQERYPDAAHAGATAGFASGT